MIEWGHYLQAYIDVANQEFGRDVWKPYSELMAGWDPSLHVSPPVSRKPVPSVGKLKKTSHDPRSLDRR